MKVVLITGASSGLGLEIAKLLAKQDYHLILTARKSSLHRFRLAGLHESDRLWIRPLTVEIPAERIAIIDEATLELGGIDVLVNNAGVAYRSVMEHVTEEERLNQMAINFRAPMELVRLTLPAMRAKRWGRIINISSVGGMMAMPTMAIYSASKFALEGASEALYYEVKPWNISVTLVEPGFIRSDAFRKVPYTHLSARAVQDPHSPYHRHYQHMSGFIERWMKLTPTSIGSVAKKVDRVINSSNPPLRLQATPDAYMFDLIRRWLPRRLYHYALYNSLPGVRGWGKGLEPEGIVLEQQVVND